MKRLVFCFIAVFALVATAFAQTPEEILAKMDEALKPAEEKGMSMAMDVKVPIIGTTTSMMYMLGDKVRSETKIMGHQLITFSDGTTDWEYDTVNKELTITDAIPGEDDGSEAEMFSGITDDYDVKLKKETADAWYLECKKSKNCQDKDAPDKMELVVSKVTNLPVSLTAKISGVKCTLRDVKIGVSEEQVRFDPADYPDAKIVDKRKK